MSDLENRLRLLTVPEVCELTRWSRATVYRMLARGDLPAQRNGRYGRSVRIRAIDLERFLDGEAGNVVPIDRKRSRDEKRPA